MLNDTNLSLGDELHGMQFVAESSRIPAKRDYVRMLLMRDMKELSDTDPERYRVRVFRMADFCVQYSDDVFEADFRERLLKLWMRRDEAQNLEDRDLTLDLLEYPKTAMLRTLDFIRPDRLIWRDFDMSALYVDSPEVSIEAIVFV